MSKRQTTRAAARQPKGKPSVVAGFRSFFICLLLAGIIGSAVRLYFSAPRIENFLRSQIAKQNLKYNIEFKSARLTLARGIFPTFAIDVSGVKVSHFAPCMTEPFADVSLLILPIDWFKLFAGRIQLGYVVADTVSFSADRAQCKEQQASLQLPADNSTVLAWVTRDPQQVKPWFRVEDLERAKQAIAGVEIKNATVYFDNSKKFVQVSYFDVWHKGESILLEGEVTLPTDLTYGESFPPLRINGNITPEVLKLQARSSFDEGELGADIELTQTEVLNAPNAKVLVRAGAMPLSVFSDFLRKLGVLSNSKLQPKFLWLNCELSSEGPLPKLIKETALRVDKCMVEGDAGRIDIGPAVRSEAGVWQPFDIEIKHFNIEDLLKTFGEKGPSGVLSSFGTLKGTLNYASKDQQTFSGAIEELEIYFSNRNVRAFQKIETIEIKADRIDEKVSGKIFNVTLSPGKATGETIFAFDKKFASGNLNFDLRELSLDPKIERLMADGIFEGLALKGQLAIKDHKIANWSGKVQATSYIGSQLKISKPVVETSYSNSRFDISAQASSGELSPGARWLEWVKRAASDINISSVKADEWIPISNIKSQISVEQGVVGWKNASLTATQSKVQVTSTGEIRENREAAGLLTTIEPGGTNRKFVISGSAQSPTLTPRN